MLFGVYGTCNTSWGCVSEIISCKTCSKIRQMASDAKHDIFGTQQRLIF